MKSRHFLILSLCLAGTLSILANKSSLTNQLSDSDFIKELVIKLRSFFDTSKPETLYMQLDRTLFDPGESVWFKTYIRDANTLKPSETSEVVYLELIAPSGNVEQKLTLLAPNGSANGHFKLASGCAGGIWKIKTYTMWGKNTSQELVREITVQRVVLPHLNMKLNFEQKAYGPGQKAVALLTLQTLEKEPLSNTQFTYTASIEGNKIIENQGFTDEKGDARLVVSLPATLKSNDGLVNVMIRYQGQTESISRSIPIVLGNIDLQFLPEGGDYLAGFPSKLAFKALDEFGKPADVSGHITDNTGQVVAKFSSYHNGMGALDFTPEANKVYTAHLTKPVASNSSVAIPTALERGYALRVENDKTLEAKVYSTENETLELVVLQRGKIAFSKSWQSIKGQQTIAIPTQNMPIGVASVSLFDSKKRIRAERLVFVNKQRQVKINIRTDKEKYLPRDKVKVWVEAKDDEGLPISGDFSAAVVDDKQLSLADNKQANLLGEVLLAANLKGNVDEPNYYFLKEGDQEYQKDNKNRDLALDYLLMTQGWKRFNWEDVLSQKIPNMAHQPELMEFKGVVTGSNNEALGNVEVSIKNNPKFKTTTNKNGEFSLKQVPINEAVVLVVNNGKEFVDDEYTYNDYNRNISFLNKGRSTIAGKVTDEKGEAMIGATATAKQKGRDVTSTSTDIDGFFDLSGLHRGVYDLEITYVGYKTVLVKDVKISAGGRHDQNVRLEEPIGIFNGAIILSAAKVKRPTDGSIIRKEQLSRIATVDIDDIAAMSAKNSQKNEGQRVSTAGARSPKPSAKNKELKPTKVIEAPIAGAPAALAAPPAVKNMAEPKAILQEDIEDMEAMPQGLSAVFENEKQKLKQVNDIDKVSHVSSRSKVAMKKKRHIQAEPVGDLARMEKPLPPPPTRYNKTVEFYAPQYKIKEKVAARTDFRKTLHWLPKLELDRSGRGEFEFYMNDDLSQFRIVIEGFGNEGGLGRAEHLFFSQLPLQMTCKVPTNLLTGDQVSVPLTLTNNTNESITADYNVLMPVCFSALNTAEANATKMTVTLAPNQSKTYNLSYQVTDSVGIYPWQVYLNNQGDGGSDDHFVQKIRVSPRGFPVSEVFSSSSKNAIYNLEIKSPIKNSVKARLVAHPNALKEVMSGLEGLMRHPSGCFEQTSSSNYPNILALNYMREAKVSNEAIETKCKDYMDIAYKRLTGYECPKGGFDWWGRDPGHEELTAYGIMQFVDMKKVYDVDQKLIDRSTEWLLNKRDGKGSWLSGSNGLHAWVGTGAIRDAYITYALTEAGKTDKLKTEINTVYQHANTSKDPYIMALAVLALHNANDNRATTLMDELLKLEAADHSWNGKSHSVTASRGKALQVETTALTLLAIMRTKRGLSRLNEGIKFLHQSKTNFGYGNTQATVLALKALVNHAQYAKQTEESGTITLKINGKRIKNISYTKGSKDDIVIQGLEYYIGAAGKYSLEVEFETKSENGLPYELEIDYTTTLPNSQEACQVAISTQLAAQQCKVGETIRLTTTLTNKTTESLPSTMAIIGIPAGLSPQLWQLKELRDKKICDYYEIFNGYLVLHYATLTPKDIKTIHLDLKAELPGKYEAPASSSFLYYTNELKNWHKPEAINIL